MGEGTSEPGPGLTWAAYCQWLVDGHGSLAALAVKLAQRERASVDAESIERGIRRLRAKRHGDGGAYGARLLRAFGLPKDADARVRWMGTYHARFSDLPVSVCLDQLRVWSRPPISESRARVWLELGFAGCALRLGDRPAAARHLAAAQAVAGAPVAAKAEGKLLEAYLGSAAALAEAEALVVAAKDPCLTARWLDQSAYAAVHAGRLAEAKALYARIPSDPPFAACKRESGLAYVAWKQGHRAKAEKHAEAAVREAGDGGFTRLRLTHLGLLARIAGSRAIRARAIRAARYLEDAELVARLSRG